MGKLTGHFLDALYPPVQTSDHFIPGEVGLPEIFKSEQNQKNAQ